MGLNDVAKKVKAAAGMYFDITCFTYPYSDSMSSSTLRIQREDIQTALIALFKSHVSETDQVSREVLSCVLGTKTSDFNRPIIDISTNPHLSGLSRQGVPPIVWETKERHSAHSRTVLDPISTAGQHVLLEFLGMSFVYTCTYFFKIF